ncbi:MAG: hypothetical protein AVDCRST_MAG91-368, partial [uncultured Sphingomonadaceae bacterium]
CTRSALRNQNRRFARWWPACIAGWRRLAPTFSASRMPEPSARAYIKKLLP